MFTIISGSWRRRLSSPSGMPGMRIKASYEAKNEMNINKVRQLAVRYIVEEFEDSMM